MADHNNTAVAEDRSNDNNDDDSFHSDYYNDDDEDDEEDEEYDDEDADDDDGPVNTGNSLYDAFANLKLIYLRKALSREGISTVGTKEELAQRLVAVVSDAQDYTNRLENMTHVELRQLAFENNIKERERGAIMQKLMIEWRNKRVPKLFMGMSMSTVSLRSTIVAAKEGIATTNLISTERNAMIQVSFVNAEPVSTVRFVTTLDQGRLEFQRDIYQSPLRALFNRNTHKIHTSAYWLKPYFDITGANDKMILILL